MKYKTTKQKSYAVNSRGSPVWSSLYPEKERTGRLPPNLKDYDSYERQMLWNIKRRKGIKKQKKDEKYTLGKRKWNQKENIIKPLQKWRTLKEAKKKLDTPEMQWHGPFETTSNKMGEKKKQDKKLKRRSETWKIETDT